MGKIGYYKVPTIKGQQYGIHMVPSPKVLDYALYNVYKKWAWYDPILISIEKGGYQEMKFIKFIQLEFS